MGMRSRESSRDTRETLSRRERQIMELLWAAGRLTAADVQERLPDPPGYSAVRALLKILENKKHVRHVSEEGRYVFSPTLPREKARRSALESLVTTFFDGSTEKAVAALLDRSERPDAGELDRLSRLIEKARKEGR